MFHDHSFSLWDVFKGYVLGTDSVEVACEVIPVRLVHSGASDETDTKGVSDEGNTEDLCVLSVLRGVNGEDLEGATALSSHMHVSESGQAKESADGL